MGEAGQRDVVMRFDYERQLDRLSSGFEPRQSSRRITLMRWLMITRKLDQ
jgi:hypothetical protein